ncbi:MAG: hypothetical protein ACLFVO_24345 [Chloroflexaceae bacterium]
MMEWWNHISPVNGGRRTDGRIRADGRRSVVGNPHWAREQTYPHTQVPVGSPTLVCAIHFIESDHSTHPQGCLEVFRRQFIPVLFLVNHGT